MSSSKTKKKNWASSLGPGLITGASDDDPSGIATYSQAGAQFGFTTLWTMLFTYPLMATVQEISARIGRVTGQGISANILRYYGRPLSYIIVFLLLIANTLNLGADIGAMGEGMKLLLGGSAFLYAFLLASLSVLLQIFVRYTRYVFYLKWLTMSLFAYVATVFIVKIPWTEVLHYTFLPHISFNKDFLIVLIALFGTTISPYLFFWQASEEAEDEADTPGKLPLSQAPEQATPELQRITFDTYIGMAYSNIVSFCIILATAATLHTHGMHNIETAAQAAEALRPLAGKFAFLLFTLGIIGTGLLALPVLAGSSAYAVGETFGWPIGLEKNLKNAKGFYTVLLLGFIVGLFLIRSSINPMKVLFWAAVINGVIAVPVMIMMILIGSNPKAMGKFTIPLHLKFLAWITVLMMFGTVAGLLVV